MIYTFLVLLHVIVSFLLVVVILLQSSKGGGLAGSTFGGGASMSFLGARGTATFLSRATTILAIVFMLNSLGLSLLLQGIGAPRSVTQQELRSGAANLPRVPTGSELSGPPGGEQIPVTTPEAQEPAPGQTSPEGGAQNP